VSGLGIPERWAAVAAPFELIDDLDLDGISGQAFDAGWLRPSVRRPCTCHLPTMHVGLTVGRVGAVPDTIRQPMQASAEWRTMPVIGSFCRRQRGSL